jgi:hypothetical protein
MIPPREHGERPGRWTSEGAILCSIDDAPPMEALALYRGQAYTVNDG